MNRILPSFMRRVLAAEVSMGTSPVHPVLLHGLMLIAVLVPLALAVALVAIRRGARPWRALAISLALAIGVGAIGTLIVESGDEPSGALTSVASTGLSVTSEEVLEGLLIGWIALLVLLAVVIRPHERGLRGRS